MKPTTNAIHKFSLTVRLQETARHYDHVFHLRDNKVCVSKKDIFDDWKAYIEALLSLDNQRQKRKSTFSKVSNFEVKFLEKCQF